MEEACRRPEGRREVRNGLLGGEERGERNEEPRQEAKERQFNTLALYGCSVSPIFHAFSSMKFLILNLQRKRGNCRPFLPLLLCWEW